MTERKVNQWLRWVLMMVMVASVSPMAHPHDEDPEILWLSGTLTKVDVVNRAIELDAVDRKTNTVRNLLLFVDAKVKLRKGKARIGLGDLRPGQRVTCTAEREYVDGGERLRAFEIRLETRN